MVSRRAPTTAVMHNCAAARRRAGKMKKSGHHWYKQNDWKKVYVQLREAKAAAGAAAAPLAAPRRDAR